MLDPHRGGGLLCQVSLSSPPSDLLLRLGKTISNTVSVLENKSQGELDVSYLTLASFEDFSKILAG